MHLFTAVLCVPLTAFAASAAFRHDRRGVAAALLWLVYGASFLAHDMLATSAELVMLLPAAWAIAVAADERRAARSGPLVLAGLLLGLATLAKHAPRCGFSHSPGPPSRARRRSRAAPPRVLALAAGFALPILATWIAFAATGGAGDLAYWLLWRNVLYAANPITPQGALERAASYLLPWLLATAPLSGRGPGRPDLDEHGRRLTDGLVLLAVPSAIVGFRFFPHYFIPAGFALSLAAAPAVARWFERPRASRAACSSRRPSSSPSASPALTPGSGSATRASTARGIRCTRRRGAARDRRLLPGRRLFVWGWAPGFYYEAGLRGARPASRFAVLAQAGLTDYVPGNPDGTRRRGPRAPAPAHWDWLMADLERTRPAYILDTSPAGLYRWDRYPLRDHPRLERLVGERYERIDDVARVSVYRRLGCAARLEGTARAD